VGFPYCQAKKHKEVSQNGGAPKPWLSILKWSNLGCFGDISILERKPPDGSIVNARELAGIP